MYRVLCDGKVLHDIRDPGYQVLSPKISVELNKTGNLDFGMLSTHPHVNDINKLKSKIEVYEDDELLFSGRSLTNEQDFQNTGQISCEGELAFLLDSVQRAHDYGTETTEIGKADTNISIFKRLIEEHNAQVEESKRFTIGVIDIDSVTITKLSTNYEKTWDFLSSNFLGKYDGYLRVRHENGIRYLDYVKQYGKVSNQVIRFGENLLDLKKYSKAEDIKTAIIPLGAVVDNKNVDIKAANGHDGTDYVYNQEAVNLYGWIYDKVDFFDKLFEDNNGRLGFHYTVSKDSFARLEQVVNETIKIFKNRSYFDKVSLLRFVPHGKGTTDMDLSKEELLAIKNLYSNSNDKDKIRLGTPWNILGIENTPCIIADEIMIIGFDGIAYPCDSIKYFTKLGISGNIRENSLMEMYDSEYFSNIRKLNTDNSCSACEQYSKCKSGCIGQKIIANYTESDNKVLTLKRCINSRDPKCMR